MQKRNSFFLIFVCIFTIFYCKQKVTFESRKPSPVVFLNNVSDTSQIEQGIDAIPEGDAIRLEWIPSPEKIVSGYEIYRKDTKEGTFQMIVNAEELEAYQEFYLDESVEVGIRYFYYILAATPDGEKSDPSDTLDYKLIQKAKLMAPSDVDTLKVPIFLWSDENEFIQQAYVIRLIQQSEDDYVWICTISGDQIDWGEKEQSIQFNMDGKATIDSLEMGQTYQWRIDIVGTGENCGSESVWNEFTISTQ